MGKYNVCKILFGRLYWLWWTNAELNTSYVWHHVCWHHRMHSGCHINVCLTKDVTTKWGEVMATLFSFHAMVRLGSRLLFGWWSVRWQHFICFVICQKL
jgi:hypothetical protein